MQIIGDNTEICNELVGFMFEMRERLNGRRSVQFFLFFIGYV